MHNSDLGPREPGGLEEKTPGHQVKICSLPTEKKVTLTKERALRKVTTAKKWKFDATDYTLEKQFPILKRLFENLLITDNLEKIYKSEIQHKIASYRSQDVLKKLYNPELFVDYPFVIRLLMESELNCFYCKKKVWIVYPNVREPMQWSLERIDNTMGHNQDNVVIACLSCNLRRRTMYYERFLFTQNIGVVRKIE